MNRSAAPVRFDKGLRSKPSDVSAPPPQQALSGRVARLRIMHVLNRLDTGGTEKVMMKVIDRLDPGIFEHCVCTLRGVAQRARAWTPNVTMLQAGDTGKNFQFNILRLAKLMKAVRPDIVHSRNWGGIEAIFAARLARVPVVIHSEHGYDLDMVHGLPLRQAAFRHLSYRCANAIFTVSDELRSYHAAQAGWSSNSIRVLHNGVDTCKFTPRSGQRSSLYRELGIPPGGLVVGFVGRMVALKDVLTLLKSVENVVSATPDVRILLVGSGPDLPRIEKYISHSLSLPGRVILTGDRHDIPDLMNLMDIFVLPSLLEGMSNTLLEALASGLPVLATRVGGNPEVVEDGRCGYLFNPGDVAGLSDRLHSLLHNEALRARLGEAARQAALTKFSLQSMLRRYSDLYLGLAEHKGLLPAEKNYVRD